MVFAAGRALGWRETIAFLQQRVPVWAANRVAVRAAPRQRCRCRSLRFLIRLPQVAMSHQAPAWLWERS
jgi:hypothetical protein